MPNQKDVQGNNEEKNFDIVSKIFLKHLQKNRLKNNENRSKIKDDEALEKFEQELNV